MKKWGENWEVGKSSIGRIFLGTGAGLLLVLGIEQLYNIRSEGSLFSNSVTAMLFFGLGAYAACRLLNKRAEKRTWRLAALAGLLFSGMTAVGHAMNYRDTMWMKEVFGAVILLFPMGTLLWKGLFQWLEAHMLSMRPVDISKKIFFFYWGALLLLWMPTFLASYPGIYAYDTGYQLNEYMYGGLSSHHPVIHTWLLGITMRAGVGLFHSSQAGAFLYTVLQLILFSAMLAGGVYYLRKEGGPRLFCWLVLAFYGLHPANSLMALAATKDTLFSGFMLLLVFQIWEMAREPQSFFSSGKKLLLFAGNLLGALAFRNNAFHMVLLFLPLFLWNFRRQWKRAVLVLGAVLALHLGITKAGYSLAGIEPGDPREMCSIFMQTAARAYNLVYLDLTEEEKEGFYTVIAEEGLQAYLPHFADPVKAYFDGKGFFENPFPFLKAWSSVGRRYTKLYVDAVLANNLGYWYPGAALPDSSGLVYLEYGAYGNGEEFAVKMEPKLPILWKIYDKIGNEAAHQKIPVISFLFSIGSFVWALLAGMLLVWRQKKYPALLPLLLLLAYLATLFLGPVVKLRYVYPIIVCLPVTVYLIFVKEEGNGQDCSIDSLL